MNLRLALLSFLLAMAMSLGASAEEVCPFRGHLDFVNKSFTFSIEQQEGGLNFKIDRREDLSYGMVLNVENIHAPFFGMTTHILGVVHVQENDIEPGKISGRIWSESTKIGDLKDAEISGNFELASGVMHVHDLSFDGFLASGYFAIDSPYQLDAHISFEDVDIAYFLDWLIGSKKKLEGEGKVSGQVALSGTPGKLWLKANLVSQNGSIKKVAYDLLSLQLQGIYPMVELTNSTVTKTNGFSFDLDGTVDLSDQENMASQIKSIKKIPLINDNALQSQWVLKRVQDSQGEGKTETKFFLKKDKKTGFSGQEDSSLLGVEKKIGF